MILATIAAVISHVGRLAGFVLLASVGLTIYSDVGLSAQIMTNIEPEVISEIGYVACEPVPTRRLDEASGACGAADAAIWAATSLDVWINDVMTPCGRAAARDLQHRLRGAVRVVDGVGRRLQRAVHHLRRRARQVQRAEVPDGVPRHAERREPERAVQPVLGDLLLRRLLRVLRPLPEARLVHLAAAAAVAAAAARVAARAAVAARASGRAAGAAAASTRAERAAGAAASWRRRRSRRRRRRPRPRRRLRRSRRTARSAPKATSRTCTRCKKRGRAARTSPRSSSSPPPACGRT